jgi:Glycosyltransferase 61
MLRREAICLMQVSYDYHIAAQAGCPKELSANVLKHLPTIGFLNRASERRVDNHKEILKAIQKSSILGESPSNVTLFYMDSFDKMTFEEQIEFMPREDILFGPHGAQFTSTVFQPACSGLLDLFPKGYYLPFYFGSLARATGHYHFSLCNGGDNITEELQGMLTFEGRMSARGSHFRANASLVVAGVQQLALRWQMCCDRREHGGLWRAYFRTPQLLVACRGPKNGAMGVRL